ncbi:MAG: carotenoid biosynthesis protein [Saprospiraceae bacterium]|nr:carotenoid biosynthesis protein [Saprospiraceae bacterium]
MEPKSLEGIPRYLVASGILILLYSVGIAGILFQLHPDFILLTPLNLLISLGLILWLHEEWSVGFILFLAGTYFWGVLAEMIGVQTGIIFGDYQYGRVLGPKVFGTPLIIGVNWMMLVYACGIWVNQLAKGSHWVLKGILGALLLVGLDILIEPVAIRFGFWTWAAGWPPLRNYIGWFFVALPVQLLFARFFGARKNIAAQILFILQIVFFALLGLLA